MAKKMILTIGYGDNWAISTEDAFALASIFTRAVKVKRDGYAGPWFADDDQAPPIDAINIGDVVEKVADADSVHLKAARNLP